MVIFFDNTGDNLREIRQAEHNVMAPTFPENLDIKGKIKHYNNEGLHFISLPCEMGGDIFNYNALVDANGDFISLQPKEGI